jgi:Cation efflux family
MARIGTPPADATHPRPAKRASSRPAALSPMSGHGRQRTRSRSPETILVVLSAGPKTPTEIEDAFRAYGRRLPGDPRPRVGGRGQGTRLGRSLALTMAGTVDAGWAVECEHGDQFQLTEVGRAEADRVLADLRSRRGQVHRLLRPSSAAAITMIAQIAITAIKVPAALASGSTGQLNDAAEELLDVIASTAVYLGVRRNAERLANVVVVALMAATGCLTLALAVHRLAVPATPAVNWYPLTVAAASVPVYAIRSAYERSAGLRGGNASLVSQSVDSRNHALAGLAVTAGLISVTLHATVIDTITGLVLALTILKSCADLTRDMIRSPRGGQQPGQSRYSLWIADRLEQAIRARIETWLLYLIGTENVTARADLLRRAVVAADPDANPLLREYGMEADARAEIEPAIDRLIEHGLLLGTEPLAITSTGRRKLQHALRRRL